VASKVIFTEFVVNFTKTTRITKTAKIRKRPRKAQTCQRIPRELLIYKN